MLDEGAQLVRYVEAKRNDKRAALTVVRPSAHHFANPEASDGVFEPHLNAILRTQDIAITPVK